MASVHQQVQAAVAQAIRDLALEGIPPERVYESALTETSNKSFPSITVFISGIPEQSPRWFTNTHLKYTYGTGVLAQKRGSARDPRELAPYLEMRDAILHGLSSWKPDIAGRLSVWIDPSGTIGGMARARSEPGQTSDPQGPAGLKVAGAMVVWVEVVRPRAVGG